MSRMRTGVLVWSLKRYTKDANLWDRPCFLCKTVSPVFEYEHRDTQDRSLFHYLCEDCAQKHLTEWLQGAPASATVPQGYHTDFDTAFVSYEQKNDGETLTLSRWSPEQRRRRLQGDEA